MKKDLSTIKGTIAYVLCQESNSSRIFSLIEKGKIFDAKVEAIRILDNDESLKSNPQLNPCKSQILRAQGKNHLMSILATYMTGCKVS